MQINIKVLNQQATNILAMINSGELQDSCSMSAVQTPVKEAWCIAEDLTEQGELSTTDKDEIYSLLDNETRQQLKAIEYDDFDLVYEYLLQKIHCK